MAGVERGVSSLTESCRAAFMHWPQRSLRIPIFLGHSPRSLIPANRNSGWTIRLIFQRILKALLKRAPPSFTVEFRRQRKRAATSANSGLVETKLARFPFVGEPLRAPAPEIGKVEPLAAEPAAPRPPGRVLPDLAEIELQCNRLVGALSHKATRLSLAPRGRKAKPETDAGEVVRPRGRPKSSSAPPTYSAPILAESAFAGRLDKATVISPSYRSAPASGAVHDIARPIPARATRHDKPSKSDESPGTLPSLEALQAVIVANAPSTKSTSAAEGSQQIRQRKILGRYVFGNDLKPGERWKRRLPKGALR
jgi:hypothetical protein